MDFMQSGSPLGRLIFGICILASAIMVRDAWPALMLLLATIPVVRLMAGTWEPCRNAWRVLRWLLIPIVLLHLVFTPGTIIFPQIGGPSYEALHLVAWLSLRLSLIFMAAMVFSRMLSIDEWAELLLAMPYAGPRLYPYLRLMFPMRASMERIIRTYRQQWCMRRQGVSVNDLANLLGGVFVNVMAWSERQGMMLWLRWGEQEKRGFDTAMDGRSWLMAMLGNIWLLVAAML